MSINSRVPNSINIDTDDFRSFRRYERVAKTVDSNGNEVKIINGRMVRIKHTDQNINNAQRVLSSSINNNVKICTGEPTPIRRYERVAKTVDSNGNEVKIINGRMVRIKHTDQPNNNTNKSAKTLSAVLSLSFDDSHIVKEVPVKQSQYNHSNHQDINTTLFSYTESQENNLVYEEDTDTSLNGPIIPDENVKRMVEYVSHKDDIVEEDNSDTNVIDSESDKDTTNNPMERPYSNRDRNRHISVNDKIIPDMSVLSSPKRNKQPDLRQGLYKFNNKDPLSLDDLFNTNGENN